MFYPVVGYERSGGGNGLKWVGFTLIVFSGALLSLCSGDGPLSSVIAAPRIEMHGDSEHREAPASPVMTLPTPTPCATSFTISGTLSIRDLPQVGRLYQTQIASTCQAPTVCPGVYDNRTYRYDVYTFTNLSGSAACVTANLRAVCDFYASSAAYLGSYQPDQLCVNYLADAGHGNYYGVPYSFSVPAGATFEVVVFEVELGILCPGYTLTVSGLTCPSTATSTPTVTPGGPTFTPTPTPPPACGWNSVSAPTDPDRETSINSLAVIAPDDIWAVGIGDGALAMHWDGETWTRWSTPRPGDRRWFTSVSALASDDVWAVGVYVQGTSNLTLTMHWDGTSWTQVPSPNVSGGNDLSGVAAIAPNDVWAVGGYGVAPGVGGTITMHWNGTQWSIVPSPNGPTGVALLTGVTAIDSDDIWAVGNSYLGGGGPRYRTFTIHWDGTQWNYVFSPNGPENLESLLTGVSASASNDVWAVGHYGALEGAPYHTLTLHWDGAEWSLVSSPNIGEDNFLQAVVAISPTDAIAVGQQLTSSPWSHVTMRWDGTQWDLVDLPHIRGYQELNAAAASSSGDVWVAGDVQEAPPAVVSSPLFFHYSGECPPPACYLGYRVATATATIVPGTYDIGNSCNDCTTILRFPFPITFYDQTYTRGVVSSNGNLQFVDNTSNSHYWSICPPSPYIEAAIMPLQGDLSTFLFNDGIYTATLGTPPNRQYVIEWRTSYPVRGGRANFELIFSENSRTITTVYGNITDLGRDEISGLQRSSTGPATSHSCWEPTLVSGLRVDYVPGNICPGPSPTGTPAVTAISTRTPTATVTPIATVATVTPCSINFTDVQPSDYFYEAVRYLYCAGVISGYGDGTFHPYNNTIRGQICKIVVLAEGWQIQTPSEPTFQDVPADNAFFPYIETAYSRGIVTGYSCGTDCLEFRPDNYVNRGQLTKIVVLAEGWEVSPPSVPTFRDVPTSDPFYGYVESAYAHEVITGYSCGAGCLEFRPTNNATRGQICKIVFTAITSWE